MGVIIRVNLDYQGKWLVLTYFKLNEEDKATHC